MFPISEWSPGPYTPPGWTITVGALDAALDRVQVGEVALDELAADSLEIERLVRGAHESDHRVAAIPQLRHQAAADEPRPPGHERPHEAEGIAPKLECECRRDA